MRNSNEVSRLAGWQSGSCRGLQILVHRFNSGTGLQKFIHYRILFRLSSAVEQSAVNRLVACSNQAAGAIKKTLSFKMVFFLCFWILVRTGCSISGSRMKTTAAPVVFTARGAVLLSSARCISKQSAIYKTSDRRAVSECFARTY